MATSKARKVLFGCLIGCGGLLLLAVGSCVGVGLWLNSPGDLLEPSLLVGDDTTGYIEWTLRLEDPGTAEFVDHFLGRLEDMREDSMPLSGPIGDRLNSFQARNNRKEMQKLFPMAVAWTLRPGTVGDDDLHLLSFSSEKFDHQLALADWFIGWFLRRADGAEVLRYRGEKIYAIDDPGAHIDIVAFIRNGDLFVTGDVGTAERAVDSLLEPGESTGSSDLAGLFAQAPEQPLRGAISNRQGELLRVWRDYLDEDVFDVVAEEAWASVRGLTVDGSFTDDGSFTARLEFHLADAEIAAEAEPVLSEAVERALGWLALESTGSAVRGDRVRFDLRLGELVERLEALDER